MDTTPIRLTDEALEAIMHAAAPLQPHMRGPFLEEVAAKLAAMPEAVREGGQVSRLCREVLPKFFDPPDVGGPFTRKFE